jgi:hypothetical protein
VPLTFHPNDKENRRKISINYFMLGPNKNKNPIGWIGGTKSYPHKHNI